jgi:hypothetical protein
VTYSRRTRQNTAVLLIDHQVGLFTGIRDLSIKNSSTTLSDWPKPRRCSDCR